MFTNPYAMNSVDVMRSGSVILTYQNDDFMQRAAIKLFTKQLKASGKLPVTISKQLKFGAGL